MHSKKFIKTERRGLPGGPNESYTRIMGMVSTEGYKKDSPDKDNPFNIIPSGNITMKDVEFPVMGVDNLGNSKMMMPGADYIFPGNAVFEIPAKSGIEIKPENKGKFTRWAKKRGMTVKQAYAKVLANKDKYPPSIVKMANFARNAAGWKKQEGGEEAPTQMLDEVVVTAPKKKKFFDTTLGKILSYPLKQVDNTIQILGIPGSLIAEGIEGIGGKGDGRFNLKDIIPDFNKNIFQEGAFGKTPSQVLNVSGVPGFLLDIATDPLTYVGGAGILRNIGTKSAQKAPKVALDMTKLFQRGLTGPPSAMIDARNIMKVRNQIDDLLKNNKNLDEPLEMLARGADEIDDFLRMRLKTIEPGSKGYTKMNNMHKEFIERITKDQFGGDLTKFLDQININPNTTIDDLAELMSNNRYAELEGMIGNTINSAAKNMLADGIGDPSSPYYYIAQNLIKDKGKSLLTNASYSPGVYDDVIPDFARMRQMDKYGPDYVYAQAKNPEKFPVILTQRVGSKADRQGTIGIGPMFTADPKVLRSVLDHEIGHAFSLGRDTPLAEALRYLKPKPGVSARDPITGNSMAQSLDAVGSGLAGDYKYFTQGNTGFFGMGDEPIAFASGLKRSLIDRGLIKGYDDIVTPEILEQASKSFTKDPAGIVRFVGDKNFIDSSIPPRLPGNIQAQMQEYLSNTRLLDFIDPSEYKKLAELLNKVPAVAPIAVAPGLLPDQKKGGTVTWKFKGKEYSGTLLPERETSTHRYALTHNGKIKSLPKADMGKHLKVYKEYIDGEFDGLEGLDYAEKIYNKLNRVYRTDAKEANMSTPNYIMTYLVNK